MSTKRTIGDLSKDLDGMIAQLGLSKLASTKTSADGGGIGESAGVIGDAGTSQPAKQEADRSNIQPATEGAQSAANTQILKDEVPANVASANPSDASNSGAASSTENTTTATMVGKDPKVEDDYGSRQETLNAPSTTHPADVNKDPEKYSAQLIASASFVDKEFEKLATVKTSAAAGAPAAGAPAAGDAPKVTVADRISEIMLGKEASAEDKDAAIHQSVHAYLSAFAKTASLIGEMTADTLELLYKQAEGELPPEGAPAEGAPAEGGDMIPAEALAAGDQSGAMDADAEALAAAAAQIAEQLGVSPEDVLEAAAQELVAGEAGGGAPAEGAPAEMAPEGIPAEAPGAMESEKMASVKVEELKTLRAQAEELAQYKAAMAQAAEEDRMARIVSAAVASGLSSAATTTQK